LYIAVDASRSTWAILYELLEIISICIYGGI